MSNPLLLFWYRLFATEPVRRAPRWRVPMSAEGTASAPIFLIMRRMRAPLIVLIVIFAISTLGLTLIPGHDADGRPWRMGFFDAFYVMSYTASTIGYGEIPYSFSYSQRMWVTISIFLTVVGWAYAIGSLLALLQDRGFRQALAGRKLARNQERANVPCQAVRQRQAFVVVRHARLPGRANSARLPSFPSALSMNAGTVAPEIVANPALCDW